MMIAHGDNLPELVDTDAGLADRCATDPLFGAACGVRATLELYQDPHTARPKHGLFPRLDRLIAQCERLTQVVNEISPGIPETLP